MAGGLIKGFTVQVVSQRRVHCNARSHARGRLEHYAEGACSMRVIAGGTSYTSTGTLLMIC